MQGPSQEDSSRLSPERQPSLGLVDLRGHFFVQKSVPWPWGSQHYHCIREAFPVTEEHALLVSPTKTALVQVQRQEVLWMIHCPADATSALSLAHQLLALASREGVFLWDVRAGCLLHTLTWDEEDFPTQLAFSADGLLLAVGLYETGVQLWQVAEGRLLRTLWGPNDSNGSRSVACSPDGQWLASGTHESEEVYVWRLADGELVHHFQGPGGRVGGLAFSPDGRLLVSGDGSIGKRPLRVWEMPTGLAVRPFPHSIFPAFSPDGHLLASIEEPPPLAPKDTIGAIFIAEVESRREIQRLTGHTGRVRQMAFSPQGESLLSCGLDGTVRWWKVLSGQEVYRLEALLAWSPGSALSDE